MATVYLALQTSLGRQVALKVLAPALAAQRGFTTRFLNEGRIIAYLKHPQIVDVYDLGSHHHDYYLAMEFLSAGTLAQKIRKGISPDHSVQLTKQIATALGFAHQQGVIHRDVKPQNILFRDDGLPVLTDFGIARLMDGGPQLTIPGRALGSPFYMSPEQINGCAIDERSDLYALGIIFYKMLTNKLPYESEQIMTIALLHKSAPLPILPDDLSAFQPVVNRLLAKNPDHRFSSARELIEALERIESGSAYPTRKTDHPKAFPQPRVSRAAAERIGLLDLERTNRTGEASSGTLGPTLDADQEGMSLPSREQTGHAPGRRNKKPESRSRASSGANTAWKKGMLLGGATLILSAAMALAVGIFKPTPFMGWFQPSPGSLTMIGADAPLQPIEGQGIANSQRPPEIPFPHPRTDPPPPETAPADRPTVEQRVADLMAKAENQLAGYRLTAPPGDNCYETVQQILTLDPSNPAAESIVTRITETYRRLALGAQTRGQLERSLRHVGNGLRIRPGDSMLLALQSELRMAISEKTRIESQRARLAEALAHQKAVEQQKRQQAADQAAADQKRKARDESDRRRKAESERALREKPSAEQATEKQGKMETEIDLPPGVEKEADRPSRLFGTF